MFSKNELVFRCAVIIHILKYISNSISHDYVKLLRRYPKDLRKKSGNNKAVGGCH